MAVPAYGIFVPTGDRGTDVNFSHVVWISFENGAAVLHLTFPGPDGTNIVTINDERTMNALWQLVNK